LRVSFWKVGSCRSELDREREDGFEIASSEAAKASVKVSDPLVLLELVVDGNKSAVPKRLMSGSSFENVGVGKKLSRVAPVSIDVEDGFLYGGPK
jgi:hypothetical protein